MGLRRLRTGRHGLVDRPINQESPDEKLDAWSGRARGDVVVEYEGGNVVCMFDRCNMLFLLRRHIGQEIREFQDHRAQVSLFLQFYGETYGPTFKRRR